MTTIGEFSEEIGISKGLIHLVIGTSKNAGIWPGEDLVEEVTIRRSDGRESKKRVRNLTEEQMGTIENVLVRMGENERARNECLINFARTRGKERMTEGGVPEEAWSTRGRERIEGGEPPRKYPPHPIV